MTNYREMLAYSLGRAPTFFSRFDFGCVIGSTTTEEIFRLMIARFQIEAVTIHNEPDASGPVERLAMHYTDGLGNFTASVFAPEADIGMAIDAYFDLGCIFFSQSCIAEVLRFGDLVTEGRRHVFPLIQYYRERLPGCDQSMDMWAGLKNQEDERLIEAGVFV